MCYKKSELDDHIRIHHAKEKPSKCSRTEALEDASSPSPEHGKDCDKCIFDDDKEAPEDPQQGEGVKPQVLAAVVLQQAPGVIGYTN